MQVKPKDLKSKAMISQPIVGKSYEEVVVTRDKAIQILKDKGYLIVNTSFIDGPQNRDHMKMRGIVQVPIALLSESLDIMSKCHAVFFCKGWEYDRSCKIQHAIAINYNLKILYEY